MSHGSAAVSAHEGVRGTGRQAEDQRNEVQVMAPRRPARSTFSSTISITDHPLADGLWPRRAENEGSDEVPESCPDDGAEGRQDASGDDSGDGVGGCRASRSKIQSKGKEDNDEEEEKLLTGGGLEREGNK